MAEKTKKVLCTLRKSTVERLDRYVALRQATQGGEYPIKYNRSMVMDVLLDDALRVVDGDQLAPPE